MSLRLPQQLGLQVAHGDPLRHEALADLLLLGRAPLQLGLHRREVPLGGGALAVRRLALALRLRPPPLVLAPLLARLRPPLRGVG